MEQSASEVEAQLTHRLLNSDSDDKNAPLTQRPVTYASGCRGDTVELEAGLTRSAVRGGAGAAGTDVLKEVISNQISTQISLKYVLRVQMAEECWEPFTFSASQSLETQASVFLQCHDLKSAFQRGLVARMRQMVASGKQQSSVDIVDLI